MIETGIYSLLSTEPTITTLVGSRIYPVLIPTDAVFPLITYQIVGGQTSPGLRTTGMQKLRLQFDCWGTTYLDAAQVRAALIKFLNGLSCLLSDGTRAGFQLIQPTDFYAGQNELFRSGVEVYCMFVFPSA